jgi:hypothetical protein
MHFASMDFDPPIKIALLPILTTSIAMESPKGGT